MKRILCIRLVDWPIQRIRAERPELDRKPIVLEETRRGSRRVAACSAQAKALGIAAGMPLAEAVSLAGSASLCVKAYDPAADREALEAWANRCEHFSPVVGLDDSPAPDSLLLDLTGVAHLFGGEAAVAGRIAGHFAGHGLAVRVAVADTIGAAWAVCHFGKSEKRLKIENCKLTIENWETAESHQSSICNLQFSILNLQSSLFRIPPGQTPAALRPLPVEALRLPGQAVELLHLLGIYQVGQLEVLPRADLTSRFGPQLLERWDQATGRLGEPIRAQPAPPELCAKHSLEHPTARRETIELLLEPLVAEVARALVRCGRGAVRLDCRLDCPPGQPVDLSVGLFRPIAAPRYLFELLRVRLDRVWLAGPVAEISVRAAVTAPFERRQEELFADGSPRRLRQLAGLVDRLASRLGRNSVLRARLVSDAQPERACHYEPLVAGSATNRPRRSTLHRGAPSELPPRPLRLLARPVPLAAVSIMPDGPPLQFRYHGCEHRIAHTWGPERIETGWWRGRAVRRDYYRIQTTTGRRYWLFRQLDDGGWFLHGAFE
jgi:protein ImuB